MNSNLLTKRSYRSDWASRRRRHHRRMRQVSVLWQQSVIYKKFRVLLSTSCELPLVVDREVTAAPELDHTKTDRQRLCTADSHSAPHFQMQ